MALLAGFISLIQEILPISSIFFSVVRIHFLYTQTIRGMELHRINGRKVVLFHYPIQEWNGFFRDAYHVHGHVHAEAIEQIPGRYNACCDVNDFTPQSLDELIAKAEI